MVLEKEERSLGMILMDNTPLYQRINIFRLIQVSLMNKHMVIIQCGLRKNKQYYLFKDNQGNFHIGFLKSTSPLRTDIEAGKSFTLLIVGG